jgi:hypothetical protein
MENHMGRNDLNDLDDRVRRSAEADPAAVDRVVAAALANRGNAARVFPGRRSAWRGGGRPAGRDDNEAAGAGLAALRMLARPRAFATFAACLVVAIALGVWWSARTPAAPADGIYRVEALQAVVPDGMSAASSNPKAIPDGVYRTTANLSLAPSRVIRVTFDDGTTWILSTETRDDWLPRGTAIVVGGGRAK